MRKSFGSRFVIVGVLTLLMAIPLILAADVINSRKSYSRTTIEAVGKEWGGAQVISGPIIMIPVAVTSARRDGIIDPKTGAVQPEEAGKAAIRRDWVYVNPDQFDVTIDTVTETRHRGIFNVPVYRADITMTFDFPLDRAESMLTGGEMLVWDEAKLVLHISDNAALRGEAELSAGGNDLRIEPIASAGGRAGIEVALGDPRRQANYRLHLGLNGAQMLKIAPVGRQTTVTMRSDWPHPSFAGGFLPDRSDLHDGGFEAVWTIPHLARTLPQLSRDDYTEAMRNQMAFGVSFFEPNDFYQKAFRAAKYGILFVALTFLTVLLIDRNSERPAHPVQYILIGLAQSIFVLLMVSYAEQIGFGPAYLLSAGATVLLITFFGWRGLGLGKRAMVLFATLVVVYAVLYLILKSADYALIAGSTLAFVALAATMWITRNEDWYGPEGIGTGWRRKPKEPEPSPEPNPPEAPES